MCAMKFKLSSVRKQRTALVIALLPVLLALLIFCTFLVGEILTGNLKDFGFERKLLLPKIFIGLISINPLFTIAGLYISGLTNYEKNLASSTIHLLIALMCIISIILLFLGWFLYLFWVMPFLSG